MLREFCVKLLNAFLFAYYNFKLHFQMQRWTVWFFKALPCPCGDVHHGSMTAWGLDGHAHSAATSALDLYAQRFFLTLAIFSWYELRMVKDQISLQCCAEKHCFWTDWQFSLEVWHEVVNHDPSVTWQSLRLWQMRLWQMLILYSIMITVHLVTS